MTNEEMKHRILKIYAQFISDVDADLLGDYLKQENVLSIDLWLKITAQKFTAKEKCRAVLDFLLSSNHPSAFLVIRQALENEDHYILETIDKEDTTKANTIVGRNHTTRHCPIVVANDQWTRRMAQLETRLYPSNFTNEVELEMKSRENGTPEERNDLNKPIQEMETREPNLIRTLIPKAASKGNKAVFGLTILGEELFVLINGWPEIEVFGDLQVLESRRQFLLTGHELEIPWDIQSSSKHNCLYIVDKKRNEEQSAEIVKIDPEGIVQKKWTTECITGRLSVTHEFNVIFTSLYKRRICEYSPDGALIRMIDLPSDVGVVSPWLTLKRSKDEYIVSHGNRGDSRHGVCVINPKGNIRQYFGGKKGSNNDQLYVPVHMVAYSDGHILVADKDNNRVILLSPELKFLKALFSQGEELRFPSRICLDESNKQLFVADNLWISDIKPWGDGRVLVFDMSSMQTSSCRASYSEISALSS